MLHQQSTARWALSKYAVIIPLAFGLLAMTTTREKLTGIMDQATGEVITVSGQVKSKAGRPLVGANVVLATTGKGTPTDAKGRFVLRNVPKNGLLSASFVGFTLAVVPIEGKTKHTIVLTPAAPDELPTMGATAAYKAIKPNPSMPVRTPPTSETINGEVFTAVEEPAVFPTGVPGLMQYVAHTLRYPAKAKTAGIQGTVLVQFIVQPNGIVGAANVKKGIGGGCDEEALRVVHQMPKWIPGKQNGKAVATQHSIPIQFALEPQPGNQTGQASRRKGTYVAHEDVSHTAHASADSQPATRLDSSNRLPMRLRPSTRQQLDQNSPNRYTMPYRGPSVVSEQRTLPGEESGLLLVENAKETKPVDNVDANEIESIEVYRDAETIAKYRGLYGAKANKGVIIIHLKSNKSR